jgi:pimeloyl-ACP methyl ester carboxylesterase
MKLMRQLAGNVNQTGFSIGISIILFQILTCFGFAQEAPPYGANPDAGHYLKIDDAKIYYEVYGQGEPIVLLHGGLYGYIEEYKGIIPDLSRNYRVIAIATRGHGKSELGTQHLSYRLYAKDFAALIRNVSKQPVNVVGFSDGAIAAYHLAAEYPELVKRLIAVGGPIGGGDNAEESAELDDYDTLEEFKQIAPDFVARREKLMPDPTVWDRFLSGLVKMWNEPQYISPDRIRSIQCPTLIAGGDRDRYISSEDLVDLYRLFPKGQLAIIPGSGHTVFKSNPALMVKLIRDFLNGEGTR